MKLESYIDLSHSGAAGLFDEYAVLSEPRSHVDLYSNYVLNPEVGLSGVEGEEDV